MGIWANIVANDGVASSVQDGINRTLSSRCSLIARTQALFYALIANPGKLQFTSDVLLNIFVSLGVQQGKHADLV